MGTYTAYTKGRQRQNANAHAKELRSKAQSEAVLALFG